jgi:hypothetical protein
VTVSSATIARSCVLKTGSETWACGSLLASSALSLSLRFYNIFDINYLYALGEVEGKRRSLHIWRRTPKVIALAKFGLSAHSFPS